MTLETLRDVLPDYAKDIRLNLGSVISETGAPGLSITQILGTALASAYATKHPQVIAAITAEVSDKLTDADVQGIKAATAIMGMNNIYYRFVHLVSEKEYHTMPANLRMNIMANPGIEKLDFELYSLAVSAINGCGMCIDSHVKQLEKHGLSRQGVQSSIRIAASIHAAAQVLVMEASATGGALSHAA